jgi:hypothetical protein
LQHIIAVSVSALFKTMSSHEQGGAVAVECCSCFGRGGSTNTTSHKQKKMIMASSPNNKGEQKRSISTATGVPRQETTTSTSTRTTTSASASTSVPPLIMGRRQSTKRASIYFEAQDGIIEETSLEFFDALQDIDNVDGDIVDYDYNYSAAFRMDDNKNEEEEEDDDSVDDYPVITRASAPRQSRRRMSILEPETLLREMEDNGDDDDDGEAIDTPPSRVSFVRRASTEVRFDLQKQPTTRSSQQQQHFTRTIVERGFPGQLDSREVQECQDFYRAVTARKGTIRDIVFCYKNLDMIQEEEPYTLCRFLRPVKFSAVDAMTRLEKIQSFWEKAAKHNFYYDLSKHMGIPHSLFQKFYPFFYQGTAKNGCPVNYFCATKIHVEGLLSMVSMEQIQYNAWYTCRHVFPAMIAKAQAKNPNFVRFESISVIDLEGLGSNQASNEAMEIMKQASTVGDFFPETMHATLILNAPAWFSVTWRIIRTFLDPRTARKIEVYTNRSKGQIRLQQLVSRSEIPFDFGGIAPPTGSIGDYDDEDASRSPKTREALHILHVSKKGRVLQEVPSLADINVNETMTALRIFSRSTTGVLIDVYQDDKPLVQKFAVVPKATSSSSTTSTGKSLDPYVWDILPPGKCIKGPCRISLTAHADPKEKKPPSKSSYGYFVAVAFLASQT